LRATDVLFWQAYGQLSPQQVNKLPHATDWVAIVFLMLFALLAVARYFFADRFQAFLRSPISSSYPTQHLILSQRGRDAFSTLMELLFYPGMAITLFAGVRLATGGGIEYGDWLYFLEITIGLALFIVAQNIFINFYALLFDTGKVFETYNFQKMTLRQWGMLVPMGLVFIAVFFEFNPTAISSIALVLLVLFYLWGWFFSLFGLFSNAKKWPLQFILYLCALELSPLLIAIKWVVTL
jgi:hypothetical protein